MNNKKIYELLLTPISLTCKKTGTQICHLCEREDCVDNDNLLVKKIKKLEKELNTIYGYLDTIGLNSLKERYKNQ